MTNQLRRLQKSYEKALGGGNRLAPTRKGRPIREFDLNIQVKINPTNKVLQVGELIEIGSTIWKIDERFDCDGRIGYVIEMNGTEGIVFADELEERK